jgi:quercetin dioxygenase-like cupin family protein
MSSEPVGDRDTAEPPSVIDADPGRFVISRRQTAPRLVETDMNTETTGSAASLARFEAIVDAGYADGIDARLLYRQRGEHAMSAVYIHAKPGRPFVRHSHDTNCIYVVMSGEVIMGSQVLRTGDLVYVPANHPYSYRAGEQGVEVLEFRTERQYATNIADNSETNWQRMVDECRARRPAWLDAIE